MNRPAENLNEPLLSGEPLQSEMAEMRLGADIASTLKHRLDRPAAPQAADGAPLLHDNIRGPGYYH